MSSKAKTTSTKEDSKPALVPKLRFPDFLGKGEWEPTTIGALGRFYYGKSAPKWSLAEDAPTPCVRYGELYTKYGPIITETYSRTNTDPDTLRFSKGGEILIPRVGEKPEDFGKCCAYLPLKGIAIGEMISVFETKQHPLFYTYYFRSMYKQFAKVVEGQNVKNLYYTELEPLPIRCPSIAEQQKIAECVSSVDEVIAAQARKVAALKTHKKGLMQQLFPREGETQPRLRFPEFQNAGEWHMRNLGEVAENLDNRRVPITSSDRVAGDVPYYGASGVVDYVDGYIFDEDLLCVSEDGANLVARTYPIAFPISGKTWVNNHAHVLRFENPCTQKFVEVYLNSIRLDDFITGMAQPKLNKAMLDRIPIPHPDIPEQQSIADCLTSLDNLIAAQTQKLDTLNVHKRGLMQQLFPSQEEAEA